MQKPDSMPPLAAPADRFAAFVIDNCILMLPIYYLIFAPFKRMTVESTLLSDSNDNVIWSTLGLVIVLLVMIVYQSVCVWWLSGTFGQRLLSLKVRSIFPSSQIHFFQSISRSLYLSITFLLGGYPLLAMFSNSRRRAFHDRASDTIVVAERLERSAKSPVGPEISVVRGLYAAVTIFFVMVFGLMTYSSMSVKKNAKVALESFEEDDLLCASVSDALAQWVPAEEAPDRLVAALTLYAAGAVENECLKSETENVFSFSDESELMYLVKSFLYSESPELSNRYLQKVCEVAKDSNACHFSRALVAITDKDESEAQTQLDKLTKDNVPYAAVWAAKYFLTKAENQRVLTHLAAIPEINVLSDFIAVTRVKALWGVGKTQEALGAEGLAYSAIGLESKLELASYMCFEKNWKSCDQIRDRSCHIFSSIIKDNAEALAELTYSLTELRRWECEVNSGTRNSKDLQLTDFPLENMNESVKSLVSAMTQPEYDVFNELLKSENQEPQFISEVYRRLIQWTNDESILKALAKDWGSRLEGAGFTKVGFSLLKKFNQLRLYSESYKITEILKTRIITPQKDFLEQAIVAAFQSGHKATAQRLLSDYLSEYPSPDYQKSGREPASASDFLNVFHKVIGSVK